MHDGAKMILDFAEVNSVISTFPILAQSETMIVRVGTKKKWLVSIDNCYCTTHDLTCHAHSILKSEKELIVFAALFSLKNIWVLVCL